jgi:hypothetical protein
MLYMVIAAKNFRRGSGGAAEGECGGNSAAPERWSPAAPPEYLEGETEQKNILFLFRIKNRARAKSKKRRIFFCEVAAGALAEASGGAEAYDSVASHHALGACVSQGSAQRKFGFRPKGTAFIKKLYTKPVRC